MKHPKREYGDRNKEVTIWNQGMFLFARQDDFITEFHKTHDRAALYYDSKGIALISCFSALRHAFLPTKHAIRKEDREKIEEKLRQISTALSEESARPNGINNLQYTTIHQRLYEAVDMLYAAQQKVGMGILKERKITHEDSVDEVRYD